MPDRTAREQARQGEITNAYTRAWRFEEEGTLGITLVNTLAFASLHARGTLHLTVMSALVLVLAAAAQIDPDLGRPLAFLLFVSSVVVPLVAGFRTAREVDKQAFLPPSE